MALSAPVDLSTLTDEELKERLDAAYEELERRDPKSVKRFGAGEGSVAMFDFNEHPDLCALRREIAAEKRRRAGLGLRVKQGDWVTIRGVRFRLGHVSAATGTVDTQLVDGDGRVVSSVPIDGAGLVPDAAPPTREELEAQLRPQGSADALANARANLRFHAAALGLEDDD